MTTISAEASKTSMTREKHKTVHLRDDKLESNIITGKRDMNYFSRISILANGLETTLYQVIAVEK